MSIEDSKKTAGLSYSITEKPPFAVVIFNGAITKATITVLEACESEASARADTLWILVFQGVTKIDMYALGPLTRLQKTLRDKGAIRTCALEAELKRYLSEKAAIREVEYKADVNAALEDLRQHWQPPESPA